MCDSFPPLPWIIVVLLYIYYENVLLSAFIKDSKSVFSFMRFFYLLKEYYTNEEQL
jgi:hypothetical protein